MRESFSHRTKTANNQPILICIMKINPWLITYIMFLLLCGAFPQHLGKTICSTKSCRNISSFSFKFTNNNPTCIETLDFVVV